jgi:hypothetical protein
LVGYFTGPLAAGSPPLLLQPLAASTSSGTQAAITARRRSPVRITVTSISSTDSRQVFPRRFRRVASMVAVTVTRVTVTVAE